jgi:hypothetical protein
LGLLSVVVEVRYDTYLVRSKHKLNGSRCRLPTYFVVCKYTYLGNKVCKWLTRSDGKEVVNELLDLARSYDL